MRRMFLLFNTGLLALIFLLGSCQSPLSDGKLNDLSVIDARIEIIQNLTNKGENQVSVFLYDDNGRPIRNKSIVLKVNGKELSYSERQELYYTTTSKYFITDVPVNQEYNFQICLSTGKCYFLGKISPIAEIKESDIVCDKIGDISKDFVISWNDLKEVNELSVTKGILLTNTQNKDQNYDFEPQVPKKIRSGGKYIQSKSSYKNSKSSINSLQFNFTAKKSGTMNSELIKESAITISGHIEKYVDFSER